LNQFSEINKKNTTLNLVDFTKALGFLLTDEYIASRLFKAFDVERDGSVDSNDFITSLSILTRGSGEEQLQRKYYYMRYLRDSY
jgi:Ca2+-binding EF-hand superfamily protein